MTTEQALALAAGRMPEGIAPDSQAWQACKAILANREKALRELAEHPLSDEQIMHVVALLRSA
jgi:hypothetical protein